MYYAGLDVSLKETFVCIMNDKGEVLAEDILPSDGDALSTYLKKFTHTFERIGIESGQLSISLCKSLSKQGLPIVCVDARHMAAALSARINKNDRNDARGIAHMLRAGLYKEVQIKSDDACELKVLLGSRRQLVNVRQQLMGTIRGLLKIYGVKLGSQTNFSEKVTTALNVLPTPIQTSLKALLSSLEEIEKSLKTLDATVSEIGKHDKECQRLMTVPGVGIITAMTYKAALDGAERFDRSETVGAYFGLTPKQYASGEIDRRGSISKMGPQECRSLLYEAAQVLLTRTKTFSKLKAWGLKLAKKKGMKKAIVAVARKLAVLMHRMLVSEQDFCFKK
jgi:transposase